MAMKLYFVYILRCFDGSFYVGVTNDAEKRFAEHCYGIDPDCYTFSRRPLQLAHVSEFHWVDEAIAFEKRLKGWTHRKKRAFVEGSWSDLKRYSRGPDKQSFDFAPPAPRSG
jgi:putative endonuclease